MSGDVTYSRAARLRLALAEEYAELSDRARSGVPTYADGAALGGEFVEDAARILSAARDLLTLAVAYERRRGVSWEVIGESLGISRQAAHERYGDRVKALEDALLHNWITEDPRTPGLPAAAADPAATARRLDRWVSGRLQPTDPLAHADADDPGRQHPVGIGLAPMTALEHSGLTVAAATLLAAKRAETGADPSELRALQLGSARRKVQMYERTLAEETDQPGLTGADPDELRDLLAGARARLADLEGDELATRRDAKGTHNQGKNR